jgi:adenylosuccinate synthase
VVIDPKAFFEEIEFLKKKKIPIKNRIFVSENAHLVFPYHKYIEQINEKRRKIGTTLRGVGPAYTDKAARIGIRAIDTMDPDILEEKLNDGLKRRLNGLEGILKSFKVDELKEEYLEYGKRLKEYMINASVFLNRAIKDGKNILFEGAQGTLLDVDHGTYPYVTSSNATAGGACTGTGVGPSKIDKVIGIAKAYTTRVGEGPFPSELDSEIGNLLRKEGKEYGATTGRPRRCGWLDVVAIKHSISINGVDTLAITKLDVLNKFPAVKICVGYKFKGKIIDEFPSSLKVLRDCVPIYEELKGWNTPLRSDIPFKEFPDEAKRYLDRISELTQCEISMVSIGPERDQIVFKDEGRTEFF